MTGASEHDGGAPAEGADRCPICLGVLGRGETATPDSCCHVFCLRCLLTWAESQTVPSCPVDRRPFSLIYRWDATLGCVLVPVKKKTCTSQPERCCTDKKPSDCLLKSKQEERLRGKTRHDNAKSLVKKCNDEDPSVMNRKKERRALSISWSLCSGTAGGAGTDGISEPLWFAEEVSSVAGRKECRHPSPDCPWLAAAVAISAWGNARRWFHTPGWSNRRSPLRHLSPFSTSATPPGFGHFVFQGRVCAVTCPKGGGKKGGRPSGSRGPTKQTESTSRRSGRNSKAQEQPQTQEPTSSHSHSTDSDSSANQSAQPGKSSPLATKRKGKQAAKRKGPGRRKAAPRVLSSPTASEDEEEAEEETELREEKGKEENSLESEHSDAEATPWPHDPTDEEQSPEERSSDPEQEPGETGSQPDTDQAVSLLEEQEQVEKEKESEEEVQSPPSKASLNSPGMSSNGSQGEEDQQDPVPCGEMNLSPRSSSPEQPLGSPLFGQGGEEEQEEDTSATELTADSEEVKAKDEASTEEGNAQMVSTIAAERESSGSSQCPDSPFGSKALNAPGASEEKPSENSSQDETSKSSEFRTKEDNQSKDDTDIVPMDCGSPGSEHSNNATLVPESEGSPAEVGRPASVSPDEPEERNGAQQELEASGEKESEERRNGRQRRSRFHSPTTTWSPKRETRQDSSRRSRSGSREQTRERDGSPPAGRHSRARSRDRERDGERDSSRRERPRERKSRKRSRSRSISRSRSRSGSRSRSRTRPHRRGASPEQPTTGAPSPSRRKERWGGDGWRSGQGGGGGGDSQRNFPERDKSRFENGSFGDVSPDRGRSNNPDWVLEKTREDAEARGRETASTLGNNRWEDRGEGASDSWSRAAVQAGWGGSERGRGPGRGGYRSSNQQGEQMENRWQPRTTFSGTGNSSGCDAYSRFNENRGGRRKESDPELDRSGWSSASSWAVRRTLPADVQSYYSRRERGGGGGGGGGWARQEEEQPAAAADPPKEELAPPAQGDQAGPLNVMRPQLNVLHYPLGPPGVALSLPPAAPYGAPPQVPLHLHQAAPLLQLPASAQALPPPPPPPPPMQHAALAAAQPDSRTTQKLQIQERAVNEVRNAIKPYYQNKDITKEEYKQIVRKAVEKVCHSKSGEVNSGKVATLVKAYVDKYKHARKK